MLRVVVLSEHEVRWRFFRLEMVELKMEVVVRMSLALVLVSMSVSVLLESLGVECGIAVTRRGRRSARR